ncbi:hypothetical protein GOBAR_AA21394 [Gossypium barbadense]|uniref:DUF7950 domain-containing protein n=1 Tax=Gossypium barbadense TaxID=3634 RepID=A0A2P5X7G6_GOSBA|nr:hypothetical protein GOBAR_AA21394 [Gossypium barbadense]
MNSEEKWRYVTYTWGSQEKTVNINPIMLRFRPIAPKPVTGESGSGGAQFASNKTEKAVTLQLLPEKTEAIGSINDENGVVLEENNQDLPSLFNLNNSCWINRIAPLEEPDRKAVMSQTERATVVESWVTVECVTETCMDGRELGSTDVDKMKNLEADTCPGFISDGLNRVQWVNGAYKRMLMAGEGREEWLPPEITVWLVIKQELPTFCTAFSCKVRLQFMWGNKCSTIMLPCDVWKMDGGGGFAWRLDVEAALSLGR